MGSVGEKGGERMKILHHCVCGNPLHLREESKDRVISDGEMEVKIVELFPCALCLKRREDVGYREGRDSLFEQYHSMGR